MVDERTVGRFEYKPPARIERPSPPPPMSDPNDRSPAPTDREPDAQRVADAVAQAHAARSAATDPPRSRSAVSLAMLIGVALLAVAVAGLVWFDSKRTQRALRLEVAQRLSEIESSAQANAKTQAQLGNDLSEAQAKVAL